MALQPSDSVMSREDARNALSYFGSMSYSSGGFYQSLMGTINKADLFNRSRLALGFPGLVYAMTIAANDHDGIDRLLEVLANSKDA